MDTISKDFGKKELNIKSEDYDLTPRINNFSQLIKELVKSDKPADAALHGSLMVMVVDLQVRLEKIEHILRTEL